MSASPVSAAITIRGGTPARRYLIALAITFCSDGGELGARHLDVGHRLLDLDLGPRWSGRRAQRVDRVVIATVERQTCSPASAAERDLRDLHQARGPAR